MLKLSLRLSKQQYMQSAQGIMAHPAFWSPFIMIGKTDAVYIKRKGDLPRELFGLFDLVGLSGGIIMKRKRKTA